MGRWLTVAPGQTSGQDFPAVAGLDTGAGLARLAGNANLYRKLLLDATSGRGKARSELLRAWHKQDLPRVRANAHTLRGVAANLGFTEVARWARDLENHSRQPGAPGAAEALEALGRELERAQAAVAAALSLQDPQPLATPEAAHLEELLQRLDDHLQAGEGAALDCLQELRDRGVPRLDPDRWAELTRQVEAFDFAAAREVLRELRAPASGARS